MKQKLTHFVSIPMNSPEIMKSFTNFKESVLRDCSSQGVEESVFISANKLHLTVGVMSLMDDEEKLLATTLLTDAKEKVIMPILNYLPLKIRMKGLAYMKNNPEKIDVLYAKVEECGSQSGSLQQVADGVVDHFHSKGLMKKEEFGRKNVNLHVTLLNSRYRARASSQDVRTRQRIFRQSFDGTQILEKFGDYEFGVMEFGDIHLSQFGDIGADGYYLPLSIVSCAQ
ncbi:activating signal cointegrator 1 complex subunit 1-like [Choristoneura fumiferana]|uniref:activating signal cointegrator 1 complex subunit 1-like n=1 Tax=Choristoneura fumiferana TaxID=7141 RepID=UPI003D1584E4